MKTPVAMFVYNRADNTRKTLEALRNNTEAPETDVYVFSDGGKDEESWKKVNEVRGLLHDTAQQNEEHKWFKSFNVVERPENFYLERNIIEGIGFVLDRHDTIVVLEDDIVTSPFFLNYMNQAFLLYQDDPKVMHVSGFTNLCLPPKAGEETYFTPHMSGWGWGTWKTKWQTHFRHFKSREEALQGMSQQDMDNMQYGGVFPCLKSLDKKPIPWDICWEIAIYKAGGLCLTPYRTMVRNIGLLNGTHFKSHTWIQWYEFDREPLNEQLQITLQEPETDPQIEALFKEAIRDWGIRYTKIGKVFRFIYKKVLRK